MAEGMTVGPMTCFGSTFYVARKYGEEFNLLSHLNMATFASFSSNKIRKGVV
jgi:hypothetical protein